MEVSRYINASFASQSSSCFLCLLLGFMFIYGGQFTVKHGFMGGHLLNRSERIIFNKTSGPGQPGPLVRLSSGLAVQ